MPQECISGFETCSEPYYHLSARHSSKQTENLKLPQSTQLANCVLVVAVVSAKLCAVEIKPTNQTDRVVDRGQILGHQEAT